MKVLLIDDLRNLTSDRCARTFDEGISALQDQRWDLLLLDHDLGDPNPKKTGYDILSWLEEHPQHVPGDIKLVTQNPVGRQKMQPLIDRLLSHHWCETKECWLGGPASKCPRCSPPTWKCWGCGVEKTAREQPTCPTPKCGILMDRKNGHRCAAIGCETGELCGMGVEGDPVNVILLGDMVGGQLDGSEASICSCDQRGRNVSCPRCKP